MKRILFFALAALMTLGVGCSKDPEAAVPGEPVCKYTLPELSATLDAEGDGADDAETRTGLNTYGWKVNWNDRDRIAIINTKTNRKYLYVLASGANSTVGKFVPVDGAAAYDDLSDLKAVYPALAASVSGGQIAFEINKMWSEEERKACGITGTWGNDTPFSFTYNDIKISCNTPEELSAGDPVNFKFRQLGTWCIFLFDFTQSKYASETMKSMTVTTTRGTTGIGGKAVVDLSDPAAPKLKAGSETAITWNFASPTTLYSSTASRAMMLFSGLEDEQLKITAYLSLHTLTFYATPQKPLTAGTVLRFPIKVDGNFSEGSQKSDFTYSVVTNVTTPFYYYGKSNCLLLTGSSGSLDITPYQSNSYFERTGSTASGATKATQAKVIWKEHTISNLNVSISGNTLNVSGVSGYGNAVVGIYNGSTLLWSYHIWHPSVNPTQGLLTYKSLRGNSYEVMPLFLGATVKAAANTVDGIGLCYQWGRKDPLGRPNSFANSNAAVAVDVPDKSLSGSTTFFTNTGDGVANMASVADGGDVLASYEEESDGPMDRYIIDYSIKHPTQFLYNQADWTRTYNPYLWGDPMGYTSMLPSDRYKSVFDPCPEGYRVAQLDLWTNFTADVDGTNTSDKSQINASNVDTFSTDHGYSFYYEGNKSGRTDFYPATGYRYYPNGSWSSVGTHGYFWSSASYTPYSSSGYILYFYSSFASPTNSNSRGNAHMVRCIKE